MAHYIGVDVGTGSARACIIDDSGEILAVHSEPIQTWNSKPDFYEQSTSDIWDAICKCTRRILADSKVASEHVKGVGFDATCSLVVFKEDTDDAVSVCGPGFAEHEKNVILWMDHRCPAQTARINATKHKLLKYVGGTMSIEMEIPKVLWLKENMPPELFSQCKFYDLADALTHMACGAEARSYCSAVCKQGYVPVGIDGSVKGWQDDFLNTIGLPELAEDNFRRIGGLKGVNGDILSAGSLVGHLNEKAAIALGLAAGTSIGSGVIDAYAGWVGTIGAKIPTEEPQNPAGHSRPEEVTPSSGMDQAFTRLAAVAGTSTCHLAMSREAIFVPGIWGPYRDVILENFWMAEGGQSATGSLLQHVLTTHPSHEKATKESEQQGLVIFDYLNRHLETLRVQSKAPSISFLARHLFFYGDLHGNRSPIADASMRGSIIGLSMATDVDDLALRYYATMEFIAQQTRHIVETLNDNGHSIKTIFLSGGGQCRNEILVQLMATATRMPVVIPKYVDTAVVLGAAMLGAAAAITGKSQAEGLWDIMERMSKPGTVVHPASDSAETDLLDVKYKIFLDMARTQQKYRRQVDQVLSH